jgi:predicted RNA polymerase sigma factor
MVRCRGSSHGPGTDRPQILALYEVLMQTSDNPVVALSHTVAAAMVHGPRVGLELLENVGADRRIAAGHRLHAIRANLLEMAGDRDAARHALTWLMFRGSRLAHRAGLLLLGAQ